MPNKTTLRIHATLIWQSPTVNHDLLTKISISRKLLCRKKHAVCIINPTWRTSHNLCHLLMASILKTSKRPIFRCLIAQRKSKRIANSLLSSTRDTFLITLKRSQLSLLPKRRNWSLLIVNSKIRKGCLLSQLANSLGLAIQASVFNKSLMNRTLRVDICA